MKRTIAFLTGSIQQESIAFNSIYLLFRLPKPTKSSVAVVCLVLLAIGAQAQTTEAGRVSFTVTNSSLKGKMLDFKHFNSQTKKRAAYGYGLNALGSHAVNLPAPVRVYEEKNGKTELLFVVRSTDDGKSFSVTKEYEISREDYLEAANQELNEQSDALEETNRNKTVEQTAKEKGLKMVTFRVGGTSFFPSMVHVRVQLPWDTDRKSPNGFSTSLSRFGEQKMSYPVGSKVYLCDGPYWKANTNYKEKLIVTVDEEKENYLYSLQ